ncbi:MAG: hypothetical protein GY874_14905 [Desulfobacteraceae bacterium]|nr:hypothetical protein [Desulfobacteraceae bacterium]
MKKLQSLSTILLVFVFSATISFADVNRQILFFNDTYEDIVVELAVEDHLGWINYELFVLEGGCSYADFWAWGPNSAFSATAHGEFTGHFYGYIEAGVSDPYNHIVFDFTGSAYFTTASGGHCDAYLFDPIVQNNDSTPGGVIVSVEGSSGNAECFIGSLAWF